MGHPHVAIARRRDVNENLIRLVGLGVDGAHRSLPYFGLASRRPIGGEMMLDVGAGLVLLSSME